MKSFITGKDAIRLMMIRMVLLVSLVFLVSCFPEDNPYENTDYRKGTDGLDMVFAQGSPPAKVYEGSKLGLVLELYNRGAYDLKSNGKVYLTGFDPAAISFADMQGRHVEKNIPDIQGANAYIPEGGYEIMEFDDSGVEVPYGETYEPTLMATSCYMYETLATPSVCIVSSPEDIFKDDVCRPGVVTLASQGAPVAVTKVEEEVMQQRLNFIITIKNVGDGRVIDKDELDKCPFDLDHKSVNVVDVQAELRGQGEAECTPSDGRIRLINGKGVIFCQFPVELHTSYTTPLVITLKYGYSSSTTRQIEIVKPPGTGDD